MVLRVSLGERSYPIVIDQSYQEFPRHLAALELPRDAWVLSHQRLLQRHGPALLRPLRRAGWRVDALTVPESESSKSFRMAERVAHALARKATMRIPLLIAFGGGVIGDLTGFVAAIFRRGVPYVQAPTTLLAQVDSAIGGKVGVDLPQAKNWLGAFYQPRLVWNNVFLLSTLPLRQRRSGLSEIIKCAVLADRELFRFLERHLGACLALEPFAVRRMVTGACRIKARIVSRDERETGGLRVQLNFGHTVGHALEAASRYHRWSHGEAIAIGMCAASRLAVEVGLCSRKHQERIQRLIRAAGLPTEARGISPRAVWRALRYDKKFIHGRPRWVLPTRIGHVITTEDVPGHLARGVIAEAVGRR